MYSKIIRVLYYVLFFTAPLVMNSSTSELFEFNKMLLIYGMTIFIASLWAIEIIIYKKHFINNKWLSIGILAFLSSQIISTIFSIDIHTSIFGYYGRFNGGLLSIISYVILLYAFINHFDRSSVIRLLKISCFASFVVILWGLPGRFGHDMSCYVFSGQFTNSCWTDQFRPAERMFSTLGQPNWLGAYLAIHFFIGLYFLLNTAYGFVNASLKQRAVALAWFIYAMFVSTGIIYTKSRSALVAVFVGITILPIFWLILLKKESKNFVKLYIPVLLVLIIPVLYYKTGIVAIDKYLSLSAYTPQKQQTVAKPKAAPAAPNPAGDVAFNTDITDSLVIRKIVWQGATELGNRYPLFGTGVETFAYAYYFVRPQIHNLTSEWDYLYNKAHNEYLNYFATTGYVGIITYTLMILTVFFLAGKLIQEDIVNKKHEEKDKGYYSNYYHLLPVFLILAYGTILLTNFLGFSITAVNLYFYLIPAMFIVLLHKPASETVLVHRHSKQTYPQRALFVCVLLTAGYATLFVINYLYADIKYAAADRYAKSGDYQSASTLVQESLDMHYEHVYEDKLSYYLANLAYAAAYQKEKETAQKLMSLSDYYNKHSLKVSSKNMLYWKTFVKNDYLFYQITLDPKYLDIGLQGLMTVAEIAPTDSKIPYSIALFYSLMEDEAKDVAKKAELQRKSIAAIDSAIKLKPDYRDSYYLKGQLQKKYGDIKGARETFEYILKSFNAEDGEVKKELEAL